MSWNLRADDRVLSLAVLPVSETAALGRILLTGCLVSLGDAAEIDASRRALSEFDNLMFIEASPHQVPWRDGFFTKILVPPHLAALAAENGPELHRLLAPGGEIISLAENA